MSKCNNALRTQGKAYPRTCAECGLGPCKAIQIPDPCDSWAQVELHRWQYGSLPQPNDRRPLDVSAGLQCMADAIETGCKTGATEAMPSPFNVCEVMRYAARLLKGKGAA